MLEEREAIAFNQHGPAGASGSTGSPGARGEQGPRGPTGTVDASQFFTKEQSDARYPSASLFGNPVSVTSGVVGDSSCFDGEIRLIAGNTAPANWSLAHGQLLEIVGHEVLFNLIGTDYGGDGISNFRLPDLRGAEPRGAGPAGVNYFICTAGIFP